MMVHTSGQASDIGTFSAWSSSVGELCELVEALQPQAAALGAVDPSGSDWHGALFGKLRPQVAREPILVAAVCGGTNTGKSLIAKIGRAHV